MNVVIYYKEAFVMVNLLGIIFIELLQWRQTKVIL
jgi:hypothetical protein